MSPHFWFVIPVHNRRELTARCLRSLEAMQDVDYTVVVVDDGSTDGTDVMIRTEFPSVRMLTGDGNLWWSGATRVGVEFVLGACDEDDVIVLLNDDLVVQPDYGAAIRRAVCDAPDAIIGSVVLDMDCPQLIHDGGCRIHWLTARFEYLNAGLPVESIAEDFRPSVSVQTGRGVLIPVRVFRQIGNYDDAAFPHAHGDYEFAVRAARAGWPLLVDYRMRVYCRFERLHNVNEKARIAVSDLRAVLTDRRSYLNLRRRVRFAWRARRSLPQFVLFIAFDLLRVTVHIVRGVAFGR